MDLNSSQEGEFLWLNNYIDFYKGELFQKKLGNHYSLDYREAIAA
jgi:hypothetical protein